MTVHISKPEINIKEKLKELDRPVGTAGNRLLQAETPQQQQALLGVGRKNIIHNGDMRVAQRGAGPYGPIGDGGGYRTVDRFYLHKSLPGTGTVNFTYEQTNDAPKGYGFTHSQKVTVDATGYTVGQNYDYINPFVYGVEAIDADRLGWGYEGASPAVLSFWFKSSLVGTHTVQIRVEPSSAYNASGQDSNFHAGFEVSAANVWEHHVIKVPPITVNQQWGPGANGAAFKIIWTSISEQSYSYVFNGGDYEGRWIETNNWGGIVPAHANEQGWGEEHTFQLTGVQLEAGEVATPFEHRPYTEELQLCQRYYYRVVNQYAQHQNLAIGVVADPDDVFAPFPLPVTMRSDPTIDVSSASHFRITHVFGAGGSQTCSSLQAGYSGKEVPTLRATGNTGGLTAGDCRMIGFDVTAGTGWIEFRTEL